MKTQEPNAFIVLWDFPLGTTSLGTFYRRLDELLSQQGGKAFCRSTKSAYIVRGEGVKELAYAIGALAERFGAGPVGVENGTVVLPLANVPEDHFELMGQARFEVDTLCLDRRVRANRRPPSGSGWAGEKGRRRSRARGLGSDSRNTVGRGAVELERISRCVTPPLPPGNSRKVRRRMRAEKARS